MIHSLQFINIAHGDTPMSFKPHTEGLNRFGPPANLFSEFESLASGIYPQDMITKLRADRYNPVVIGYTHDGDNFYQTTAKFTETVISASTPLRVALEIVPKQLGWIEEFLEDEKEYKAFGTVQGKIPTAHTVSGLRSYRPKLGRSHSQRLALWLLENGFKIVSIEHEQVMEWISADREKMSDSDEEWWSSRLSAAQPGYTAIRRDIYGLEVMDRERPDIVAVGFYHALKYDLLLRRDGKNSFYFITGGFSWPSLLAMWKEVHELYSRQYKATK